VIAVDVRGAGVTVTERLNEHVLGWVVDTARPLEPEVAFLGAGGCGERRDQFGPTLGPVGLRLEFHDDKDHFGSVSASRHQGADF
jgi:hypothetical protein